MLKVGLITVVWKVVLSRLSVVASVLGMNSLLHGLKRFGGPLAVILVMAFFECGARLGCYEPTDGVVWALIDDE